MANKIKFYLSIYISFLRINYLRFLEYRVNFFFMIIPTFCYSLGFIIMTKTIFGNLTSLNGWTFDNMITLFSLGQITYYSSWLFYRDSLGLMPSLIQSGDFDQILKLPLNSQFITSIKNQLFSISFPFVGSFFLLAYSLRNIPVNYLGIFIFIILFINGLIIFYNITVIMCASAFWIVDSDDLVWITDDIMRFSNYPMEIYPNIVKIIFLFLIPIFVLSYIPATSLLNNLDWRLAVLSFATLFTTTFLSRYIWNLGLKAYSSASS